MRSIHVNAVYCRYATQPDYSERCMTNPNPITTTATAIADQLGETAPGARATIWRCVRVLGPERAQAFVAQALEVEVNGGMLIPDGSRKRTLGGVFFYLVRTQISDEEAVAINVLWRGAAQRRQLGVGAKPPRRTTNTATPAPPAAPTLPPFVWEEAAPIIAELTAHIGAASTVKVTVMAVQTKWSSGRASLWWRCAARKRRRSRKVYRHCLLRQRPTCCLFNRSNGPRCRRPCSSPTMR